MTSRRKLFLLMYFKILASHTQFVVYIHIKCSNIMSCKKIFFSFTVRPLEVTLLGSNQPMSALQEIEIVCQSVGSRPPAEISWYKDGQHLKSSKEEVNHLYYSFFPSFIPSTQLLNIPTTKPEPLSFLLYLTKPVS